ncbi:hypothetical protein ZOSMA_38G00150 [Zostera marina]|uniref:Uncharacterized protein n=1 Tax=Zostera marina TaxID=29655 RepID=A0A0K9P4H6_ZOSMR|nr:hypothetical protein ZOSMA_38G00150 [Zostera marina]
MMEPLPSLDKAYQMLLIEEGRAITSKGTSGASTEAVAMYANKKSYKPTLKNSEESNDIVCTDCKKIGHTWDTCYFVHGFPEGYPIHGKKFNPGRRRECNGRKNDKIKSYHITSDKGEKETIKNQNKESDTITMSKHQLSELIMQMQSQNVSENQHHQMQHHNKSQSETGGYYGNSQVSR